MTSGRTITRDELSPDGPAIHFTAIKGRRVLTKHVANDGCGGISVSPAPMPTMFKFERRQAANILDFGRQLVRLGKEEGRDRAIVRGALISGLAEDAWRLRRYADPDLANNSLVPARRAWLAADIDSLPSPKGQGWLKDIRGAARHVLPLLPPELTDVSCVVQATGSAGYKDGIRLRLWFALTEPLGDADIKRWATAWNLSTGPVFDVSIYGPAAIHFLAPPRLGKGVPDLIPQRWDLVRGNKDRATLDVQPEAASCVQAPSVSCSVSRLGGGDRGFSGWLGRIGGPEGFYDPLHRALGAAIREGLDPNAVAFAVAARVQAAPLGIDPRGMKRTKADIARYHSRRWLLSEIDRLTRRHNTQRAASQAAAKTLFPGSCF